MMTTLDLTQMMRVLDQHPDLSIDGWRCRNCKPDSVYGDKQFPERRAMLMDMEYLTHTATALEYFWHFDIHIGAGSYGLKHAIERWGRNEGLADYVTNGCAILAALMSGFEVVRLPNSQNCRFRLP